MQTKNPHLQVIPINKAKQTNEISAYHLILDIFVVLGFCEYQMFPFLKCLNARSAKITLKVSMHLLQLMSTSKYLVLLIFCKNNFISKCTKY